MSPRRTMEEITTSLAKWKERFGFCHSWCHHIRIFVLINQAVATRRMNVGTPRVGDDSLRAAMAKTSQKTPTHQSNPDKAMCILRCLLVG